MGITGKMDLAGTIKHTLCTTGVRRFQKMGPVTASYLVSNLQNNLHMQNMICNMDDILSKKGYYKAYRYLRNELPELTIGYKFDENECGFLFSMKEKSAISLFEKFEDNRAMKMWHAMYRHNNEEAVNLLDSLADQDISLLKKALLGKDGNIEHRQVADIFKICSELEVTLPLSLARLNNPVIMETIKDLDFEKLNKCFVEIFTDGPAEFDEDEDPKLIKSILSAIGVERSYDFYKYLVENDVIESSDELDEKYPSKDVLLNKLGDKISDAIQDTITAEINRSITTIIIAGVVLNITSNQNNHR
jgi:hypothetical protein